MSKRKKHLKIIEEDRDNSDNTLDDNDKIHTISIDEIEEYSEDYDESDENINEEEDYDNYPEEDDSMKVVDEELMKKLAKEHFNMPDDEDDENTETKSKRLRPKKSQTKNTETDEEDEEEEIELSPQSDMLQQLLGQMFGGGDSQGPNYSEMSANLSKTQEQLNQMQQEMQRVMFLIQKKQRELEKEEKEVERKLAIEHYRGLLISVVSLIIVAFFNMIFLKYMATDYAVFLMLLLFGIWFIIVLNAHDDTPHTLKILQEYREGLEEMPSMEDDDMFK